MFKIGTKVVIVFRNTGRIVGIDHEANITVNGKRVTCYKVELDKDPHRPMAQTRSMVESRIYAFGENDLSLHWTEKIEFILVV